MKLTKASDFAIKSLVFLGEVRRRSTCKDISREMNIPLNHVIKIVQMLSRGGYVQTVQGKGGGLQLQKPTGEITLKEIIDLVNGPTVLSECFTNDTYCTLTTRCKLRVKLLEAQDKMMEVLENTTIMDLIDEGHINVKIQ